MTNHKLTESIIENFAIELFQRLGYEYIYAPDIAPDSENPVRSSFEEVILTERLTKAVRHINSSLPADVLDEAIKTVLRIACQQRAVSPITHRRCAHYDSQRWCGAWRKGLVG